MAEELAESASDVWGVLEPVSEAAVAALNGSSFALACSAPGRRTVALGRAPEEPAAASALRLALPHISAQHARLFWQEGSGGAGCYVVDDSTNGTFVDGVRCPRGVQTPLRSGAVLSLSSPDPSSEKALAFLFTAVGSALAEAHRGGGGGATQLTGEAEAAPTARRRADSPTPPETTCVACWTNGVRALLLPCAHLCLCAGCEERLTARVCPLCRGPISRTVLVHFP